MSRVTPRALIKLNATGVQCVRHILLSSPPPPRVVVACFVLFFVCTLVIAQAIGRSGKGSYWTVNDFVDPRTGLQRVRKRKAKPSKAKNSNAGTGSDDPDMDADFSHPPLMVPVWVPSVKEVRAVHSIALCILYPRRLDKMRVPAGSRSRFARW